jgi:hypothetical protein
MKSCCEKREAARARREDVGKMESDVEIWCTSVDNTAIHFLDRPQRMSMRLSLGKGSRHSSDLYVSLHALALCHWPIARCFSVMPLSRCQRVGNVIVASS